MNEYLDFSKDLAKEAGNIMKEYFQLGVKHKFKDDLTAVTEADEKINEFVIDRVEKKFPEHSVFGEEMSNEKDSEYVWLCDPIDGTWPFIKGIPISMFSIALVKKGIPLVGVTYDPFTDRLYSAVKGGGAFLNSDKISVSSLKLKDATINIEWWPEADYDIDTAMHNLSMKSAGYVLHLGCVVNGASLVAAGEFEACVFAGIKGKSVDIAAVKVIVEEAGGKVTDLFGNEQKYMKDIKGAVVSNGVVHKDIISYTKTL